MRLLLFSDIHLHLWRKFGTDFVSGLPRRLTEQLKVLRKIGGIINDRNVAGVVYGGDLMHKVGEIPVEVINFAHNALGEWGVPICFVDGNHDIVNREDPKWYESSVDYFRKVYWEGLGGPELFEKEGFKFLGIGFGEMQKYLRSAREYDLVVVHDTPVGSMNGGFKFEEGVDWKTLAKLNKLVCFGHIHQRQTLASNCFVMGSPMHLDFGDSDERGVYILDTKTGSVEFINIDAPKFITVDTVADVKQDENYYRVLNSDKPLNMDNAVAVVIPKHYEEKVKSSDLYGMAKEWAVLNDHEDMFGFIEGKLGSFEEKTEKVNKGVIKTVSMENFGSVEEASYELKKGFGFTLVSGESDVFGSNGAGKTTMTGDAIFWCLFGETTKGLTGDEVIRRGAKDCRVTIVLKDTNTVYSISRSRSKGLSVDVLSGNKEQDLVQGLRQSDRQKILEEQVLGFDKTLFLSSCYFSQEGVLTLTSLGDADRTNFITDMLGFEKHEALHNVCDNEFKKIWSCLEEERDKLRRTENMVAVEKTKMEGVESRRATYEKEIASSKAKIKSLIAVIESKEKQLKDLYDTFSQDEFNTVVANRDKAKNALAESERSLSSFDPEIEEADKEYYQSVSIKESHASKAKGSERLKIAEEAKIAKVQKAESGEVCEWCGAIINISNIAKFIKEHKAIISDIQKDIDEAKEEFEKESKRTQELLAESEKKKKEKANLADLIRKNKRAVSDAEALCETLQRKSKEFDIEKAQLTVEIKNASSTITNHEDTILRYGDELHSISEEVEECKKAIDEIDLKKKQTEILIEEKSKESEAASFWMKAFSPKGIRSLLIDRFCNQFNGIANTYLSEISSGKMSIAMSPVSTLKSGEERNKFGMDISLDGYTVSYKSLSGGEKRRVDVSLCLALNEWVSNKYSIEGGLLGVIIFDEIFSFLDRLAEETIGGLLYREGRKKAILIISHTAELASYCGYKMHVVRKNGVSKLDSFKQAMV